MKLICTILTLFVITSGYAQSYDPANVNKKALKLNEEAMQQAQDGNFKEAIRLLESALKIDSRYLDAYLSIAGMQSDAKNYDAAISYYEKGKAIDSVYFKDYCLSYSIALAGKGAFAKALAAVNEFISLPALSESSIKFATYRKRCYQFAVDYASTHPVSNYRFEPKNLGDSVNSNVSEYFPTLTIDGKKLIFTRRVRGLNEDFYECDRINDSCWSMARPLEGNINTNFNEGAQCISQDGQWLIFTGCNFPEGYGNCDLYISYSNPGGWSVPENMGSKINTEGWESAPSLSPDKRDLYFASNRPGGYGGSDLYVSHRLPNGRWSEPENLGPTVNTVGDERSPFIHADNQTLFFTSNGHLGYGDDDLFLSRRESKGKWGAAQNLGYPINTIENEGSLYITASGTTAYYASDRSDTRGSLDLYTFELRSDVRPIRTLWVKGKVFDKKTKNGLPSAVELTDLTTRETVSKV
ncbi:MAG TPA: tetratricopeptide repeat protein, partial [Chitinophagaceae bacterium]|nr:tetratricopeptide repeat protein [Chitinophagaceae bacterium]